MADSVIPWSEVQADPQFSALSPDKKLEALNKWTSYSLGQVQSPEDQELLEAGSDLERRKILGEQVPTLQEYLPQYRARKAADQQGILSQFGGALKTGLSDVVTGLGVTFDAATGDNAELAQGLEAMNATDAIRQQNKTPRDIELEKAFAENAKQFKEAKGFWPSTKELLDYVGIAATNPVAMTKMALESAPNALISIGATTAGAVGGTLVGGPAGGVAAASAAGSAANIPMEIPGAIRQKLLEATGGQAANWNASQIKDFLDANPQVKEEGLQKGLVRGAAIGVVEGLTAGIAGKVATIPERAAQKAVLADVARQLGKEVASLVDVADFIRAGGKEAQDQLAGVAADALSQYSKAQKAGMLAGAAGIETAGEGLGELSAQVASGEEISPTDVFVEMAAGGVLSGLSTVGARLASLPGKIVNADPELRQQAQDIQNAEGLAQQAATNENASAAAAAAKAVINEATSDMEKKAAVMLNDVSSGLEDLGTVEGDLLARVPLAKPQGGEISAPETVLEGQNYEQGQPTPEPQPETTPVRPEESAPLEAVPARPGPVVSSEPGLPVLPAQPPAQAPQTDVGGGVAVENFPPSVAVPKTPTPENNAPLQRQVPENRVEERLQTDEGRTSAETGRGNRPLVSGQVKTKGEEVLTDVTIPPQGVVPTASLPEGQPTPGGVGISPSVREALRVEVDSLPEIGRSKWTPEVVSSAEDYIQNGTQDSYAKLNKTQKNLANRIRQQLGIQDEQDLQEAEMEKQMKEESKTRGSPYRNQIEQSADIPTAQVVSAVSEADFEKGLKVVEELIRNARATVISDSLDNLLSRSDITEEEKAALRKGAQGIYSNGRAIIARDNIKQTVLHTTPSQAAAAVIFHELMHKGSDILRNDPRLAESYAEWRSMLDENVTDDMLDAMVRRRGYTAWSDWRTNPTSKLRAQEEVFVRQMEDFFNRKGNLLAQEQTVFTRFLNWIKGLVEKVLGTPIEGRFKDAILEDWGRKFINAVQTSNGVELEASEIASSIETPGAPRTGTDRIATFSPEEREELANFMNGDSSFNKLKQFLGIEKAGELGQVEPILPLKMAALDTIGFTEDKAGSPNVSKTATQNSYDIAEKLLAPGSKFGATYQQEVGGAESAATAVLQMELLRYALALSRKGDSRLLAMLRKNWNSIVLGTYITATSAGRILGVRSNYVSDVLRTIEAMDKEMLKAAAKRVQQDGVDPENAESFVRNLDEVVRQAEMDYAELEKLLNQKQYSVPSVDPYAWIERAVGKIDAEDQNLVNQLFRDLAFLDKAEARKAEFAKAANAPEASFLDDIYNEEVVLPDSPEELDEVIASTKKRISETLKKLTGKPKAAKAVKEKLPKKEKQLDEVEAFIKAYEEKLKTPPAKKTTQPEMTLARLVRNQVTVPLERADFAAQAARFGATEEQANRLFDRAVVEASLLTAEKGKPVTKFTKLIKYIQSVPALMNDPEGRSAAIESFLRDNGYTDEQIKQTQAFIEPVIREQIIKAKQNALDKAIAAARKKAEQKLTPVEKNLGNKIGALSEQSFKLLESDLKKIRIGLGDREADPSQTLAAEMGFTGFRPTDYQALSELDIKITEAAKEGRPHDMAKGLRELYELLGRRRAPKTLMEVLAVAYNNSALSSVGTLAINVVAPSGSMATRVALDLGRAAATGNFKQAADIINSVVDSFKRTVKEAEYGLIGGASTVAMNQQVQRVTSLQRDFNEAISVFTQKGANTPEKRKGRGLLPKPTPTEYLKASYTAALATTDIVRRILATTDHVWSSVMQNYFLKTQAIKVLDTRVPKEVYMPALFNVSATVSQNLSYELATISDFAALMGDLKTAGKFDRDNLLEYTQTGAAEGLSPEAVSFDRDFKASIRRVVTAYDTPASIEKHLLRELGRQRNEAYLRSNDRMKVEVLNFLEEKVPGSAKGVEKFIANESDYELGTHQGEEAPVADFMNTFTNMVREAGKSITARNPVLGRMIVGYFGVPANLLNRAMWYTPYGIYRYYLGSRTRKDKVTASQFYQQSMETQAQINQRLVEALAGTAGIAMLMLLKGYDDDDEGFNVTLSGPTNKTEKDAWRKLGHRQGSLEWVFKDGSVTSLNWARGPLEPLKISLLMVGAMDDLRLNRKLGDGVLGMSISDYLSSMFYGWSKQAVFFGAKSTIGAVAAPEPDASMLSSALYKVGPVVPYSGAISSVEKFISGPDRFYGREGSIYLNLPIARSLLTERAVNALGDPQGLVPSSAWSSLNDRAWYAGLPLMVSGPPTGNDKQVYDFILRRGTGPGLPQRAALENDNGLMSDNNWLDYVATRGRIVKSEMIRNLSRLERMDDEDLSKAFGEISTKATRAAKRQLGYK